jgi:sugar lactone lactonase YvrE
MWVLSPLNAQTCPSPPCFVLGRVLGQNAFIDANPSTGKHYTSNLVEGRELNSPQGVALDTSVSPPIVYVSDSLNNRVLAWHDANGFKNGDFADVVIGQNDFLSTSANTNRLGMTAPTGLTVDAQGNLWVADSGNNRVLRYPKPFNQTGLPKLPDLVLGQPDFNQAKANNGGLGAGSLALVSSQGVLRVGLIFDAAGNLYVTDSGNHRVLRFPADTANPGMVQLNADLVLGQPNFTTAAPTNTVNVLSQMNQPSGLSLDAGGFLYVADALHRVVIFRPPFTIGQTAFNMIGGLIQNGGPVQPPTPSSLFVPNSVTVIPAGVLVSDTNNSRVLKFPPMALWTAGAAPTATTVYGQPGFTTAKPAPGATGLSFPTQVVVSPSGEFFVADSGNNRVVVYPPQSTTASRVLGQLGLDYNAPNLIEGR